MEEAIRVIAVEKEESCNLDSVVGVYADSLNRVLNMYGGHILCTVLNGLELRIGYYIEGAFRILLRGEITDEGWALTYVPLLITVVSADPKNAAQVFQDNEARLWPHILNGALPSCRDLNNIAVSHVLAMGELCRLCGGDFNYRMDEVGGLSLLYRNTPIGYVWDLHTQDPVLVFYPVGYACLCYKQNTCYKMLYSLIRSSRTLIDDYVKASCETPSDTPLMLADPEKLKTLTDFYSHRRLRVSPGVSVGARDMNINLYSLEAFVPSFTGAPRLRTLSLLRKLRSESYAYHLCYLDAEWCMPTKDTLLFRDSRAPFVVIRVFEQGYGVLSAMGSSPSCLCSTEEEVCRRIGATLQPFQTAPEDITRHLDQDVPVVQESLELESLVQGCFTADRPCEVSVYLFLLGAVSLINMAIPYNLVVQDVDRFHYYLFATRDASLPDTPAFRRFVNISYENDSWNMKAVFPEDLSIQCTDSEEFCNRLIPVFNSLYAALRY